MAYEKAFPHDEDGMKYFQPGMDLRDYFAAKCMQGFSGLPEWEKFTKVSEMAKTAYKWADAMMEARKK